MTTEEIIVSTELANVAMTIAIAIAIVNVLVMVITEFLETLKSIPNDM